MTDQEKAAAKENADAIKNADATRHAARGNVHSEIEEAGELDAQLPTPPLPN